MRPATCVRSILVLVVCALVSPSFAQTPDDSAKRALFHQIMQDSFIRQLVEDVRRDPRNQTKVDRLLIQLPLSPMDLFRIRMEIKRLEYVIPKQVFALHGRWANLHANIQPAAQAMEGLSMFSAENAILAAVVGTNRNVASTYSPAPMEYQGEVQIAVNKNNTNQILIGANTWDIPTGCDQTQALFSSIDGGTTWRYTCAPNNKAYQLFCDDPDAIVFGSDPAAYWDDNNNAFFNHIMLCCDIFCQFGFLYPTSALVVAKSTDAGLSWSTHGVISNHIQDHSNLDDKEFYIIDKNPSSPHYGRHYECWDIANSDTGQNNEVIAFSDDGITWTQKDIPSAGPGLVDIQCDMAIGSNGTVHLAWDALTCGATTCSGEATYYTRSIDGGNAWSAPVLIKSHNIYGFNDAAKIPPQDSRGILPFGAIDVDNGTAHPGRLYFAYSDVNSGDPMSRSDIYVARSDNGTTWTSVKVNDDATNTAQFHPFLAVDQTNGHVIVGWHDARNDTANNRKVDYYMSRSTDGGVTWEANTKVSQPSSEFSNNGISYSDENTSENFGANPNQYGEYLGVDAHNGKAYMAWTDSRQFYPTNTSNPQFENIGFAVVTFSPPDTTPPTTSITSPTGGTVSGIISINADATDDIGVTKVEFYVDGGTLIGTDTSSPYSISWNTTGVANGSHDLTSKAYDAANNAGTSAIVTVDVNNGGGGDVTPPSTSITSPTEGSTVSGTIPINADASDAVGVTKVEFYVDGGTLIGTDTTSPYSINWNTTSVLNGPHGLITKAYDAANNVGTSNQINVSVNNPVSCSTTTQIHSNPGFESGSTGWVESNNGIITNGVSRSPHNGTWYAKLNGLGTSNTQSIRTSSSAMAIATGACSVTLNFWLSIDTAETGTRVRDTIKIQIQSMNANGNWGSFTTLDTLSNLNQTGLNIYSLKSFNLDSYKGKIVRLRFLGKENSSRQTTFLIDDLAFNVIQ